MTNRLFLAENMEIIPQEGSSYKYMVYNKTSHSSSDLDMVGYDGSFPNVFPYTVLPDIREQYVSNEKNFD